MTTNREKAVEIIEPWIDDRHGHPEDNADCAVEALADAGVLMPDLPEPVKNYDKVFIVASPFLDCRSVQAIGDQVAIHGYKSRHVSSGEARRFAYALLAAADHAQKEETDE